MLNSCSLWPWIVAPVVALPILYVLSCPWAVIVYSIYPSPDVLDCAVAYRRPLMYAVNRGPEVIGDSWVWYRDLCYAVAGVRYK